MNNDFLSRVRRFGIAESPHEWQIIVIHSKQMYYFISYKLFYVMNTQIC